MTDDRTIPTSDKDRQELKVMLAEMTKAMGRIDDEREQITDIAKAAEEKFGIKKKIVRRLAMTMYKHNYADLQAENEHFEFLYETLIEGRKVSRAA